MKISKKSFIKLSRFEILLWVISVAVVTGTFFIFGCTDYLTLAASIVGVTALIFLAKGQAVGQILIIVFALLYAVISFEQKYYGEIITYLGMTAPMAIVALINWLRHPYKNSNEVEISSITKKHFIIMTVSCVAVTTVFYFILRFFGNASLTLSTLSISTSYIASYLTAIRSPYYAIGYAANDMVLVALWVIASVSDIGSIPMVACFLVFFVNDMYGYYSWRKMKIRQETDD